MPFYTACITYSYLQPRPASSTAPPSTAPESTRVPPTTATPPRWTVPIYRDRSRLIIVVVCNIEVDDSGQDGEQENYDNIVVAVVVGHLQYPNNFISDRELDHFNINGV